MPTKIRHVRKWLSISLIMITGAGCSTNNIKHQATPEQEAAIQVCKSNLPASKKIKMESVTYGCLASMALWKAIGQDNPAALMCVAGGAAGFLIGDSVAERKCAYQYTADQLDGEIAHANKVNGAFGLFLIEQEMDLKQQQAQLDALLAQNKQTATNKIALQALQKTLTEKLEKETYILTQLHEEQQFKQETLAKAKAEDLNQEKADTLKSEIQALHENIKKLRENNRLLTELNYTTITAAK